MRVNVVSYDPSWPKAFERIRSELAGALEAVPVLAIEHVGSTSVPGLAAKPVIDVDVIVERDQLEAAIHALETIGYQHSGDLGIPDRHSMKAPDVDPRRNVYVVVDGSLALRNHLGLRTVLRADPDLKAQYGELKLSLSQGEFDSIDGYIKAKTELIQTILERAGIAPDDRAAIRGVNPAPMTR